MVSNTIDTLIVVGVLFFILLISWSRLMKQSMTDTFRDMKEILTGAKGNGK